MSETSHGYEPEEIGAYGAAPRPLIATRMSVSLTLTQAGAVAALIAVVLAALATAWFPAFAAAGTGIGWSITATVSAVAMLAVAVIQVATWRRALASWRGQSVQDLSGERRLSWIAHVASYVVTAVSLISVMAGSAAAGWSARSAVLLTVSLVAVFAAQLLAGVQYLRTGGPPGTLPAHVRRMMQRAQEREDARADVGADQ